MNLIDKDALLAEIESLWKHYLDAQEFDFGWNQALDKVLSYLDTLDVKEIDFETAFAASIDHFDEKNNYGQWPESDLREFAEHFFELGLTQKEE